MGGRVWWVGRYYICERGSTYRLHIKTACPRQCSVGGPDALCSTGQIDACLRMTTRYITHARSQILRYINLHISGGIVRARTTQWRGVGWSGLPVA